MRLRLLVIIATYCLVLHCAWGEDRDASTQPSTRSMATTMGVDFRVSAEREAFDATMPIFVDIEIANRRSDEARLEAKVSNFGPEVDFHIVVRRGDRAMPTTNDGRAVYGPFRGASTGSSRSLRLQPGEVTRARLHVNRLFDMTLDGVYSIQLIRVVGVPSMQQTARLESEPITVRVESAERRPVRPGG